ncbi:MAG: hypothetical protein JW973_13250, partial [Bacteroidales bacterium]|nr:hypothetical protein [Bacteroidales bacterium]
MKATLLLLPGRMKVFFPLLIVIMAQAYPQAPLKIMPLGNSITFDDYTGDTRDTSERISYRCKLYQDLLSAGYDFDFVGSENSGASCLPTTPTDYTDHAGFPGITTKQLLLLLQTGLDYRSGSPVCVLPACNQNYLEYYNPDVVILHIGTNNLSNNDSALSFAADVEEILDLVDVYELTSGKIVPVFLARIINRAGTDPSGNHAPTSYYNTLLDALVASRTNDSIVLVNMETGAGIDYRYQADGGDMIDLYHPAASGYVKMAASCYTAMENYNFSIPLLSDIPDDSDTEGSSFTVTLDAYVSDPQDPDESITWTYSGNSNLTVTIDPATHIATIAATDVNWNGSETITFRATDPYGAYAEDNAEYTLTAENDNPVITVPEDQTVAEDVNLVFNVANSNLISISDADNDNQSITITVTNGTFTLSTTTGLTGSGSGTASLSYIGTLVNINAALNNAYFKGTLNFTGSASVSIASDDGNGGTDSESIPITVTEVNDPPVITGQVTLSTPEDVALTLVPANFTI